MPRDDVPQGGGTSQEQDEPEQPDVRPGVAVAVALVLTVLLTVWASFLVPLRLSGVPVPVWALPLAAMLAAAAWAGRRAGIAGTVLPAALWLVLSWLVFGSARAEGDLVVPGTTSGYAYLFGGLVLWVLVVARASAASPRGGPRR